MPNFQTIVLDTATPQLRAPGTGDGYSFDSGATNLGTWTTTGLTLSTGSLTLTPGTANGVLYLNGSKVATSGSALTFNGTALGVGTSAANINYLAVGGAVSGSNNYGTALLSVASNSYTGVTIASHENTAGANGTYLGLMRSRGTQASPTNLLSGDLIGAIQGQVFNAAGAFPYRASCAINLVADGNQASGDLPGRIVFSTVPAGSTTLTERMRLDSSGNLGLGVTPSAVTLGPAFQIANGAVLQSLSGGFTELSNNAIYNLGFKYISSSTATLYEQGAGAHKFFTAPSGTAGNAITFTQAMTLDASGNLGIGTTSPTQRLEVIGNALVGDGAAATRRTLTVNGGANSGIGAYIGVQIGGSLVGTLASSGWAASDTSTDLAVYADTGKSIRFYSAASERMRLDASGNLLVGKTTTTANGGVVQVSNGVTFPATQVACSDANTLDDYEEGTWTPTAAGQTTPGTTTYTTQTGVYTKIGREVTASFDLNVSNMTGTGTLLIDGLPFTSSSSNLSVGAVVIRDYDWTAGTSVSAFLGNSRTYMNIYISADNAAWEVGAVDASFRVIGTISYIV